MAKLVNMLPERGPTAFGIFVGALWVTGQLNLAIELKKQEKAERMEEAKAIWVLFPIVQYLCN